MKRDLLRLSQTSYARSLRRDTERVDPYTPSVRAGYRFYGVPRRSGPIYDLLEAADAWLWSDASAWLLGVVVTTLSILTLLHWRHP